VTSGSPVISRSGTVDSDSWKIRLTRLGRRDWRTPVFFEIVSREINARSGATRPTVLDIGCGLGFDGEVRFQEALSVQAGRFIGIEPDVTVDPPTFFSQVYRTTFEDAPIAHGSVDVAYAIMVMEHVADPDAFWSRLHEVLAPGGVFMAFTVNGSHWFAPLTRFLSVTRLKTRYLNVVQGERGTERYEDYPVYYRTNTLKQIKRVARGFRSVETLVFGATGNVASYAPPRLQPLVRTLDTLAYKLFGQPINIFIRAER
jgi:2-polyprenyl-3-methyl-5-hydroxy-6-metoxy-1,4-benzoquinol methylase